MPYKKGDEPVPGYRLIKLLGRGGFGEVWHATAPGNVPAALKIINLTSDQGYKEFRAIRLVKHIHHPNLVPTTGFWLKDEEGKLFDEERGGDTLALRSHASELIIAMGLGDQNLFDRLQECQKASQPGIPADELLDYLEPAAKAIDFLNQSSHDLGTGTSGIQHCDIKPQNILIVGGSAQVCDFGLARVLGESHHTQVGGTAFYTAPEVLSGNQPSKFTDQYSLAISYYHLLTGTLPFDAKAQTGAMLAHLYGKLDFTKVSEAEQAVLKRATTVDPIKRFPSCLEMVRELRRARDKASSRKPASQPVGLVEPGMEIVPGYRVERLIGKGGYGEVWEAVAPGGKHVALKVIRNLECAKGLQEFKSLEVIKGVEHNNLIELHAYWILDKEGQVIPDEMRDRPDAPAPGMLVICSRLAYKNLLDRLKECRKLGHPGIPAPELIHYMVQVAAAIDHLNTPQHPMGDQLIAIQHRDIKPENILLARDNTVKLADFGLAKVLEDSQAMVHPSSAGLTPAYAAPEMIMGTVTSWSDQYSLAVTYHHLRTGAMPFPKGIPFNELILLHLHGKLDLGLLPEPERAVISRATKVKPEERFPDCASMVRVLQKAVGLPSMWEFELPRSGQEFDLGPTPTPPPSTSRGPDSKQYKGTDPMSAPPTPVSPPTLTPTPVPTPTPISATPTPVLAASAEGSPATCTMPPALKEKLSPAAKPPGDTDLEFRSDTRPAPGQKPPLSDPEVSVKPTTIDFPVEPAPIPARKKTQPAIDLEPEGEPGLETIRPKPAPKSWHDGAKKKPKSSPGVKAQPGKPVSKHVVTVAAGGSVVVKVSIAVAVLSVVLGVGGWAILGHKAQRGATQSNANTSTETGTAATPEKETPAKTREQRLAELREQVKPGDVEAILRAAGEVNAALRQNNNDEDLKKVLQEARTNVKETLRTKLAAAKPNDPTFAKLPLRAFLKDLSNSRELLGDDEPKLRDDAFRAALQPAQNLQSAGKGTEALQVCADIKVSASAAGIDLPGGVAQQITKIQSALAELTLKAIRETLERGKSDFPGKLAEAVSSFKTAAETPGIETDPKLLAEARLWLARAYAHQENWNEARPQAERLTAAQDDPKLQVAQSAVRALVAANPLPKEPGRRRSLLQDLDRLKADKSFAAALDQWEQGRVTTIADTLAALNLAQSAKADDQDKAASLFEGQLKDGGTVYLPEISEGFARLAEGNPDYAPRALRAFRGAAERAPDDRKKDIKGLAATSFNKVLTQVKDWRSSGRAAEGKKLLGEVVTAYGGLASTANQNEAADLQALLAADAKPGDAQAIAALRERLSKGPSPLFSDIVKTLDRAAIKSGEQKQLVTFLDGLPSDRVPDSGRALLRETIDKLKGGVANMTAAALQKLRDELHSALGKSALTPADVEVLRPRFNDLAKDDAESKQLFAALETCALARDASANKRAEGKRRLDELLAAGSEGNTVRLCQAYVDLAKQDASYRRDAKQALTKARTKAFPPDDRKIDDCLDDLRVAFVEQFANAEIAPDQIKLDELFADCNASLARKSAKDVVLLAKAEVVFEKNGGKFPENGLSEAETKRIQGLFQKPAADPYTDYVCAIYVSGFDGTTERRDLAAERLMKGFAKLPATGALRDPTRQRRAAEILEAAAETTRDRSLKQPFRSPFRGESPPEKAKQAAQAFQWLNTARQIHQSLKDEVSGSLVSKLAVAAWFRDPPEGEFVRQLVAVPTKANDKVEADDLLFLRIKAETLKENSPDQALATYVALADATNRYQGQALEHRISEGDQLKYVVEPGLAVGREKLRINSDSDEAQRRAMAKLYGSEARLIGRTVKHYEWGSAELKQACEVWLNAADQAIQLVGRSDKQAVGYIVLRAYANMWLKPGSESEYESDAKAALQLDDGYAGAHLLLGVALYDQGKKALKTDRDDALLKVETAYTALGKAIDILQKRGDPYAELPPALMNRMNMSVWLANVAPEKWGTLLAKAIDDFDLGLSLLEPGDPDAANFFGALGNVLEDRVMLLTRAAANYQKAVNVLRTAKQQSKRAWSWISVARSEYRALELSRFEPNPKFDSYPKEAERLLKQVVAAENGTFSTKPTTKERAEAYYWLAKLQALKQDYGAADSSFDQVIKLGAEGGEWRFFALGDAALLLLDRTRGNNPRNPQVLKAIETARDHASEIKKYTKNSEAQYLAARIRAKAFSTTRDPLRALQECEDVLRDKDDLTKAEAVQLHLLKLSLLVDEGSRNQINAKRDKEIDLKEVAKEADAVVPAAKFKRETYGNACGLAGLAHLALAADVSGERQAAYDNLYNAVKYTYIKEDDGWRWRFEFAKLCQHYAKDGEEDKKNEFLASADKYAGEALRGEAPESVKKEIRQFLEAIKK